MSRQSKTGLIRDYRRSVLAWMHLTRVQARIAHEHYPLLAEYGLTPAQFDALSHLVASPGESQQALAGQLLVTKGNICGLIDRMEKAGLVERRGDAEDRRIYHLYATEAGRRAFEKAAPVLEAMIARSMEALGDDEQAVLLSLLGRLDRSLRSEDCPPSGMTCAPDAGAGEDVP